MPNIFLYHYPDRTSIVRRRILTGTTKPGNIEAYVREEDLMWWADDYIIEVGEDTMYLRDYLHAYYPDKY